MASLLLKINGVPQNEEGFVVFISNYAWIDGARQDSMHRCFEDKFTSIYELKQNIIM